MSRQKRRASPLQEKDYCYFHRPNADHQGSKVAFRDFRMIGPYVIEKLLLDKKYAVSQLKTNKTEVLHRNRFRKDYNDKPFVESYQNEKI